MRNAFAKCLLTLAKQDDDVTLFYADIGNRLFNPLKEVAFERTINAGIAEANMASMAAGAAKMGLKPFIYTITPFTTARNFEQIKIDIAYENLPVNIIGTGSGLSYANLGPTHHSFEDIALMRSLPNMVVLAPADSQELSALMPLVAEDERPCYVRIGKKNEPVVHQDTPELVIGEAYVVQPGEKITVLSTGTIFPVAQALVEQLNLQGINAELVSFHTIKPLDEKYLHSAQQKFERIVTIEEHNVSGGFGSAVLEFYNEHQLMIPIHRFGIPDHFIDQVGSQTDARKIAGLTVESILKNLTKVLS